MKASSTLICLLITACLAAGCTSTRNSSPLASVPEDQLQSAPGGQCPAIGTVSDLLHDERFRQVVDGLDTGAELTAPAATARPATDLEIRRLWTLSDVLNDPQFKEVVAALEKGRR